MGLHTGEAVERDGDYFGPAVNRAARLLTVAGGEQIVLSAATASLIADRLPPGARLVEAGTFSLPGLERADHVFQLVPPGAEALGLSAPAVVGNLPDSLTTYVGQSTEMKRLADDLARRRLITLTGVGGVGKTRMALEAAWAAHDEFSGGAWLVELAPIADAEGVTHAVASVLRVEPYPGMTLENAIIDALQGRQLLLIVDNCEHVIEAANRLIGRIVSSCPTVNILATSREPLGVVGERVVGVRSLDPELEAVELFCERADAADSDFTPSPTDLETIGHLCRRLDGIPLAIELAAARTRTMSLGELERRLTDRFRLLRGAGRGRVERHQTLRATVAWSHQLLSPSNESSSIGARCSPAVSMSGQWKPCVPTTPRISPTWPTSSARWSTRACWSPTGAGARPGTGSWRRCANTPRNKSATISTSTAVGIFTTT
jgi:hypothetical protein